MKNELFQKRIWVAWEKQRRSVELSKSFHCDLFLITETGPLRYPLSIVRTFVILKKERPDVLFVQNPSMVLALCATVFFRLFFKYVVVVDRHSNFLLTPKERCFFVEACFHFLSFVSIRYADLTIVTNGELANVVSVMGGRAEILPDKIPAMVSEKEMKLPGDKNIMVISSFAGDEPISEIAQAASLLAPEDIYFHFTGNHSKYSGLVPLKNTRNIVLTGFVPDQEFVNLLFSVDAVMVLTTIEYTLLCGCYEAVGAGKVLITSDTLALKRLFKGVLYVNNTAEDIANVVRFALHNVSDLEAHMVQLRDNMRQLWQEQFHQVERVVHELT